MKRLAPLTLAALMIALVTATAGCQRLVDVQTGTRVIDAQNNVVSENVRTVRVSTSQVGKYRVRTISQEAQAAELYAQAQRDIAAGNNDTAAEKLEQVVAIQPGNEQAKKQLESIRAGKNVTAARPDGSPDEPDSDADAPRPSTPRPTPAPVPTPKPSTESTRVAGGLVRWIPDTLTGFKASKAAIDPLSVSRQYTAESGQLAYIVVVAEQFRTSSAAKVALASQVKSGYPNNDSSQKISGRETYFGTDGGRFGVMGFVDGAVMVAIEGRARSGAATGIKDELRAAVEQLP